MRTPRIIGTLGMGAFIAIQSQQLPAPAQSPQTAPATIPASKTMFVFIPKGEHPFFKLMYQGFQDAANARGVLASEVIPQGFGPEPQIEALLSTIDIHPAGVAVVASTDEGLKDIVQKMTAGKIRVVTVDSPAPSTAALGFVGPDWDAAGYKAGLELAKLMKNQGCVLVAQSGLNASQVLKDRLAGFERAMKEKAPGVSISEQEIKQPQDFADALQNPKFTAVFGLSVGMIAKAGAEIQKEKKEAILLAGFDDAPSVLESIKAGQCQFCVIENTYKAGWMALEQLLNADAGKKIEKSIDTGVIIVGKENADNYEANAEAELKKAGG